MIRRDLFRWLAGVLGLGLARAEVPIPAPLAPVNQTDNTSELKRLSELVQNLESVIKIDRQYQMLPIEARYGLKLIYAWPGMRVRELARKLELLGVEETAKTIRRVRESGLVSFGSHVLPSGFLDQEYLYPSEDANVAAQTNGWLATLDHHFELPEWARNELYECALAPRIRAGEIFATGNPFPNKSTTI